MFLYLAEGFVQNEAFRILHVSICLSSPLSVYCKYILPKNYMNQNLKDGLNFASKLTIKRIWNGVKVVSSFYNAKFTGKSSQ